MKLLEDFGVTAWFGTLIIVGCFVIMGLGLAKGQIDFSDLLPMFGAWVGSIVTAYFVIKSVKTKGGG